MSLEICKLSRSRRFKICKESSYSSLDKDYCASQKSKCYGYKLQVVCSVYSIFQSFDVSPVSVQNIHYLKDIQVQIEYCILL